VINPLGDISPLSDLHRVADESAKDKNMALL
jgi:hypothetical protein